MSKFGWCLPTPGTSARHKDCKRHFTIKGRTVYCGCEVRSCKCSKNPRKETEDKGVQPDDNLVS